VKRASERNQQDGPARSRGRLEKRASERNQQDGPARSRGRLEKRPVGTDQARHDGELRAAFERVERGGRRGLGSLQEALSTYLRETGLTRRRSESPVYDAFDTAAGTDLARRARPVRFARGVLTVEVDSSSHLHELETFRGEDLRARTNAVLGRPDVRKIAFKHRN